MTRGYVTPGWAWRHHRKWFRRARGDRLDGPDGRGDEDRALRQGETAAEGELERSRSAG